jgi:hypothetical protein
VSDRRVTQADLDLVLESMIRRETAYLRTISIVAEIVGWLAVAGGLAYAVVQWDLLETFSDRGGNELARWRTFAGYLLPGVLNLVVAGLVLVVLGRGARLFSLHQAARRGMNVTGLTLGEPLDLDELEED